MKAKLLRRIRKKWDLQIDEINLIGSNSNDKYGLRPFKIYEIRKIYVAKHKNKDKTISDSSFFHFIKLISR